MRLSKLISAACVFALLSGVAVAANNTATDYLSARWSPLHFKPAIDSATDEQCLACHRDVLERRPYNVSPAGVPANKTIAWYQTLDVYEGEQDTFHRRHLVSAEAKRLMNFRCNTCHQGHDPKDEISGSSYTAQEGLVLRKSVDPDICLMCHGSFNAAAMDGVAGDWPQVRTQLKDDCVTCHTEYRTVRHQLNFLNAEEIEKAGRENSDSCYGCHGGRSWYAIPYPYVRRPWLDRMPEVDPEWAKGRPTTYDARYLR